MVTMKKSLQELWKNFECAECGNKANLGCEIGLYPHCDKCYKDYYTPKGKHETIR